MLDGARHGASSTGTRTSCARAPRSSSRATSPGSSTARRARVSVLVHDPEPSAPHAVVDLNAVEKGTATAGRQFVLGATPGRGCGSVTQFIGLVPPGRAPDHFHTYDEVIYVLEGEGTLDIDGEQARARRRLVRPPAGPPRSLPGEHRRERAAPARRLPPGRLAGRGLLPRRHARRPTDEEMTVPSIERSADVVWEGNVARGDGTITAETGAFSELPFSLPIAHRASAGQDEPGGAARRGARRLPHDVARERADRGGHAADAARRARARS